MSSSPMPVRNARTPDGQFPSLQLAAGRSARDCETAAPRHRTRPAGSAPPAPPAPPAACSARGDRRSDVCVAEPAAHWPLAAARTRMAGRRAQAKGPNRDKSTATDEIRTSQLLVCGGWTDRPRERAIKPRLPQFPPPPSAAERLRVQSPLEPCQPSSAAHWNHRLRCAAAMPCHVRRRRQP
ncbi:uncharacterized protein BKCO1_400072 [Diplodia corticola]|uniref:Uncharacterized protein n=1 Tax=Diplodia corticola TaxID=236234 RepID=A0A1J9SE86_9PEZI|nr:uncharacterized protein BKCO1_400072 [Diplodia corticola]OJD38743.1 hypothetical protein BKCO1_400072 [Diplodia corticola]